MGHFTLGHRLPRLLSEPLFGKRRECGKLPPVGDADYQAWKDEVYPRLYAYYLERAAGAGGLSLNRKGYRVMERVDLEGRTVLEIGPGLLTHAEYWHGRPAKVVVADIRADMLDPARRRLDAMGVACQAVLLDDPAAGLPFDREFDVVVSFYSLEHLHPLGDHLAGLVAALKPGGLLVGAIPCEGGLAWGLGRFLTTRRWMRANTSVDPDRIICWEHPNFAGEVLDQLDARLERVELSYWPFRVPLIDANVIAAFRYRKPVSES